MSDAKSVGTKPSDIDSLILRFRDLVTDHGLTIQLHRKMCIEKEFAWWGWWSKRHETIPQKMFDFLKKRANGPLGLDIFLFSSGEEVFFQAKCIDIAYTIPPEVIPTPEATHTPDYYNSIQYLAWFKLASISDKPIDPKKIIEEYSYVHVPELIIQEEDKSDLFDGKPISSTEELRKQTKTIWFIQKTVKQNELAVANQELSTPASVNTGVSQIVVQQLLSSVEDIKAQVDVLKNTKPGGIPESFLVQLTNAVVSATDASNRLKADILLPPKKLTDVTLAPIHLLERYNEYSGDLTNVHLWLGSFIGTLLGVIASLATTGTPSISAPVIGLLVVLAIIVVYLYRNAHILTQRRDKLWEDINNAKTVDDSQRGIAMIK